MITIHQPGDINERLIQKVAYEYEPLAIDPVLLQKIDQARQAFVRLLQGGTPCYGVTTGLGQLADVQLDPAEQQRNMQNLLRARAVAIGPPLEKSIARSAMVVRLVNFLSGLDGVRPALCEFVLARINDDFVPWVPRQGHGMAADAIANTHLFQTLIGEGFVFGPDGGKQRAAAALAERGTQPFVLADKEALALINGVTVSPAYALHLRRALVHIMRLANMVAAVSMEGLAAHKDAVDAALKRAGIDSSTAAVIAALQPYLDQSEIRPVSIQSPLSYRIVPQVHGAMLEAMDRLRRTTERALTAFSGNPMLLSGAGKDEDRLLSVGLFHDQQMVNQIDYVALCLTHVGCLSQRRLHRMMQNKHTGLTDQLAARPGLDAGLVVTQKASLGLEARLRMLAHPVSLATGETSGGQEDYMTMALPALERLSEMVALVKTMLAYELLAGLVAIAQRNKTPGRGVTLVRDYAWQRLEPYSQDRAPGPDVELILAMLDEPEFNRLLQTIERAGVSAPADGGEA